MPKCEHELEPFEDRHAGCEVNLFKWRCHKCGEMFKDIKGVIQWGTTDPPHLSDLDDELNSILDDFPPHKNVLKLVDESLNCCDDFRTAIKENIIREDRYGNLWLGQLPMGTCPFCGHVYREKEFPHKAGKN